MTKALARLLEFANEDPNSSARSKMLSQMSFKQALEGTSCSSPFQYKALGLDSPHQRIDGYKALVQTEADAINDSTLVQEEIFNTVIEGAQLVTCMREALPVVQTKSYSTRFVKGQAGIYADEVSEIGAPAIQTEQYTTLTITAKKIATRPVISKDLIDDCQFDLVNLAIKRAGLMVENKLNRIMLDEMLNGTNAITTSSRNPTGTHIATSDLALAASSVKKQNFFPDTIITHPTAEGWLLTDSNLAYVAYMGSNSPLTTGKQPKLMNLVPYTCTATDRTSNPTWDDSTAGSDVTAIVLDSSEFALIMMRQDIEVHDYDDVIHDLIGMVIRARFNGAIVNEKAACKIYHK